MSAIHFDTETNAFVLRLYSCIYLMQIQADGALAHAGFVPVPMDAPDLLTLAELAAYAQERFPWEKHGPAHEYPAFGDVSWQEVAFKTAFPVLAHPPGPGEAAHLPVRDVRLRYASHEIRSDAEPTGAPTHGVSPKISAPRETLCIRLKDATYDLFLTLCYRLTPEHDLIEQWVEVENATAEKLDIEEISFGVLHLTSRQYQLHYAVGSWAREFVPAVKPIEQGLFVLDQKGINTGHYSNPSFLIGETENVTEESGCCFFGAIAWSGNWRLRFARTPQGPVRVFAGYDSSDFELAIAPGEKHRTPAFVFGLSTEGRGGASRRMHRFIRERLLPKLEHEPYRPVLYNSWEATYFDLSVEGQTKLARLAASIGIELFCVDDGWFGDRRNDRAGLGDWVVSEAVFPQGLDPLIDEVHRLGMKFGLWVEPEMVNPDSNLYRAHPDWVLHFPGRPRTEVRQQLILDFGRPEVVEHIREALDRLVTTYAIDFFKWDMNRYASEPGSVAGRAIWRRHVEGVYDIMDSLRRAHPHLAIQSCSGGGARIDCGVLARTDQVWTSDNTDAGHRVRIQEGFSFIYPPRIMESWVTSEVNHQTGRFSPLSLRFDVAMRGALGIGSNLTTATQDELAEYRRKIEFYKRIRPIVQDGDLYRLESTDRISTWLTVLPNGSAGVYSTVTLDQPLGYYRPTPRLRGLDPAAAYKVVDEHGTEIAHFPGWQLMSMGIPGDATRGGLGQALRSRTVLLERVGISTGS
jgi:alpha-galactosidase